MFCLVLPGALTEQHVEIVLCVQEGRESHSWTKVTLLNATTLLLYSVLFSFMKC